MQWDFDEQKPKANDAGVNGWANVLKTYEGGPPLGVTRFHVCNQTPCKAMYTSVTKFGAKGPSFHGDFAFGSQDHFESPPPPLASAEAGVSVPVEEPPPNDDFGPHGEEQPLTPKTDPTDVICIYSSVKEIAPTYHGGVYPAGEYPDTGTETPKLHGGGAPPGSPEPHDGGAPPTPTGKLPSEAPTEEDPISPGAPEVIPEAPIEEDQEEEDPPLVPGDITPPNAMAAVVCARRARAPRPARAPVIARSADGASSADCASSRDGATAAS